MRRVPESEIKAAAKALKGMCAPQANFDWGDLDAIAETVLTAAAEHRRSRRASSPQEAA